MFARIVFKVFLALVLVGAVIGLGAYAYNAGVAQGLVQGAQLDAGKAAGLPYYPAPFMHHPFGAFGLLGLLAPLFLLFVIFGAMRGIFWHGQRGWRGMHAGPWGMHSMAGRCETGREVPPMVEEWHRRMHGQPQPPTEPTEKQNP